MIKELGLNGSHDDAGSYWLRTAVGFPTIQGVAVVGHIVAVGVELIPHNSTNGSWSTPRP
jgi:hypothetical protein